MTRLANEKIKEVDMGECGPPIKISNDLTCTSKNIVYVAKDMVHGKVYVGQTGREVKKRHADHLGGHREGGHGEASLEVLRGEWDGREGFLDDSCGSDQGIQGGQRVRGERHHKKIQDYDSGT